MLDNVGWIYGFLNGGFAIDAELAAYTLEAMLQKDRIRSAWSSGGESLSISKHQLESDV